MKFSWIYITNTTTIFSTFGVVVERFLDGIALKNNKIFAYVPKSGHTSKSLENTLKATGMCCQAAAHYEVNIYQISQTTTKRLKCPLYFLFLTSLALEQAPAEPRDGVWNVTCVSYVGHGVWNRFKPGYEWQGLYLWSLWDIFNFNNFPPLIM